MDSLVMLKWKSVAESLCIMIDSVTIRNWSKIDKSNLGTYRAGCEQQILCNCSEGKGNKCTEKQEWQSVQKLLDMDNWNVWLQRPAISAREEKKDEHTCPDHECWLIKSLSFMTTIFRGQKLDVTYTNFTVLSLHLTWTIIKHKPVSYSSSHTPALLLFFPHQKINPASLQLSNGSYCCVTVSWLCVVIES